MLRIHTSITDISPDLQHELPTVTDADSIEALLRLRAAGAKHFFMRYYAFDGDENISEKLAEKFLREGGGTHMARTYGRIAFWGDRRPATDIYRAELELFPRIMIAPGFADQNLEEAIKIDVDAMNKGAELATQLVAPA